ncbi:MAG TPA: calcium-binding protein [Actinomycetota bacterium]|nr:calcium-binding protein [Actinomycetota bacterium]
MRKLFVVGVVAVMTSGVIPRAGAEPIRCAGRRATIVGSPGNDTLRGTRGDDVVHGLGGHDTIVGRGGDDVICTGHGGATVDAGPGSDHVVGGPGGDAVEGGAGADTVEGRGNADVVSGGRGNDVLRGGAGGDALAGGADEDRALGSAGRDAVDGGSGSDVLDGGTSRDVVAFAAAPSGVTVDVARGVAHGDGSDVLRALEIVAGSDRPDRLLGGRGRDFLFGGRGGDRVDGNAGNDVVAGQQGDDVLAGGAGRDRVTYLTGRAVDVDLGAGRARGQGTDRLSGFEVLEGSTRGDRLTGSRRGEVFRPAGLGNIVEGRGGTDFLSYRGVDARVTVDLARGVVTIGGDRAADVTGIEGAYASDAGTRFTGDAKPNVFVGGDGDDVFEDSRGRDVFRAGAGFDFANLFEGTVPARANLTTGVLDAQGRHRLTSVEGVVGTELDDVIVGSAAANRLDGGGGNDTLDGRGGFDEVFGAAGDDTATGAAGDDVVEGGLGNDDYSGGAGIDLLIDHDGNDRLFGGAGTDVIDLGSGADDVDGGAGVDVVWPGPAESFEVDLAAGTASGAGIDSVTGIEGAVGTRASDVLAGDARANLLWGMYGGDDAVTGGAGDDLLESTVGDDEMSGGDGDDYLATGGGSDRADGGEGLDECWGAEERISCEGDESMHAAQFDSQFRDAEPSGFRIPRAVSAYAGRRGLVRGTVASLFGSGCAKGVRVWIERQRGVRWEVLQKVRAGDGGVISRYGSSVPLTERGTYRARLPSAPLRSPGVDVSDNCMGATSQPFTWRPMA